jgi:hypothetical protein
MGEYRSTRTVFQESKSPADSLSSLLGGTLTLHFNNLCPENKLESYVTRIKKYIQQDHKTYTLLLLVTSIDCQIRIGLGLEESECARVGKFLWEKLNKEGLKDMNSEPLQKLIPVVDFVAPRVECH